MTSRAPNLALKLIEQYSISNSKEIVLPAIAYELGLLVDEKPINGAEGRLVINQSKGIIVVNSNIIEHGKKRFVIAHEIGHFELHKRIQKLAICDEEAFVDWHKNRPHETEANEFAAELLMPHHIFRPACKGDAPNIEIVRYLANNFNTTLTATAIRYVEIGWFPCLLICTEKRKIKWFRKSSDFQYWPYTRGTEINDFTCASEFFEKGTLPANPEKILPKAWFSEYRSTDQHFYEHCLALPRYNCVLSLIWEDEV